MAKWGKIGLTLGKGLLASQGISLDQLISRPKRQRRRRRGSTDYAAIAAGIREVLMAELSDDELGEVEFVVIEMARLVIQERQDEEEAAQPRRKRTTKKKAKKR